MSFQFSTPSLLLQPYIKQYWAIENVLPQEHIHTQRIFATGLPELVFYFDRKPQADKRIFEGNTLLNAQQNDYYDLVITKKLSMFSITFQAEGLSHFIKLPLNELQNQSIYPSLADRSFPGLLEQQLEETTDFCKRVAIAEKHFLRLLSRQTFSVDQQRMSSTISLIRSTKGAIDINNLAHHTCLSRKQFERKFASLIGISPKQYLKIIRFQNALHLNQLHSYNNLTTLAYEAGYYDQSHFINEAKELTGHTPKKLFEPGEIVSDFFR
jgi:AraC-like DNA-binding protein